MRKYRFFYHYNRQNGSMSVHFRKKCSIVNDIDCFAPCETKWSKTQPFLVMQGFTQEVKIYTLHGRTKALIL